MPSTDMARGYANRRYAKLKKIVARWWIMAFVAGTILALSDISEARETTSYYSIDDQGSVLSVTDDGRNITSVRDYEPANARVLAQAPGSTPSYRAGLDNDESDLVYMQARYYDPVSGAFLSGDPEPGELGDPFAFGTGRHGLIMSAADVECAVYRCLRLAPKGEADGDIVMTRPISTGTIETIQPEGDAMLAETQNSVDEYERDLPYFNQLVAIAIVAGRLKEATQHPDRGAAVRALFANGVNLLRLKNMGAEENFSFETSFVHGKLSNNTKEDASLADAAYGRPGKPRFVVSVETGDGAVSPEQKRKFELNMPSGTRSYFVYVP